MYGCDIGQLCADGALVIEELIDIVKELQIKQEVLTNVIRNPYSRF